MRTDMPTAHAMRKPGDVWHSHYWDDTYTVESLNDGGSVTVTWSDGRQTTHATPLQRGDKLITRTNTTPRRAA